ncbi:MAG: thioredoxin-dependent thiol peroxidase [Planctomycetota bacterium]|nr:MAG: thioredoxin-dependent thiol peroxidase [Planctomycetota bacterium]
MLQPGDLAPSFRLPSTSGQVVSLDDFKGRKIVLYFYPKDETPGCTKEACDLRDAHARLSEAGVVVLGVSKDALDSHHKFRAHHGLPFELASDEDNAVARAYGAYGERSMYGTKVLGTIRSTFLIDESGRIARVWSPVKVEGHVDEILSALGGAERAAAPAQAGTRSTAPAAPAAPVATAPPAAPTAPAAPRKSPAKVTVEAPRKAEAKAPKKQQAKKKPAAARPKAKGGRVARPARKPAKKASKRAARTARKAARPAARRPAARKSTRRRR